jgi:hypothetical protein
MTLQPLEKLVHPLERLIQKYDNKRTRADVGRAMAEISFSLEAARQKGNHTELEYKKEFKGRAKYYEGYLSKYVAGSSKPEIEMLLLMSQALNCNLEELTEIFYPEYFSFQAGRYGNNNGGGSAQIQPIVEILPHVNIQTHLEEISIVQEFDFKVLEICNKVEYAKGSSNTVRWTKTFKLLALKDNFKILDKFDYYKCVRDKADMDITCTGEPFKIRREKAFDSDDNVVSIIFDNALQQGQEVEFSLSYFCTDVIDRDIDFHYTWIMHPTDLLRMEITPPEPENNRQAKYYVHLNKGCPWGIEKIIESADVFLNADSCSYKLEIPKPNLYTTCGIYWGRMYW